MDSYEGKVMIGINAGVLAELSVLVARAPVLGSTAGWRFRYRSGQIDIMLAPSPVEGPEAERARRLAVIGAAGAVVNLRLVIGHLGYEPRVELFHDGEDELLARVGPGRQRPPVPDEERLYAALGRLPDQPPGSGDHAELDEDELGQLIEAGVRESAGAGDLEIVQPYGAAATALDAGVGWRPAAPALVITTPLDDPAAWLATGRALQAMRLEAVCRGLGTRCAVPADHGAYSRAALGRIVVPDGPAGVVQVAVQVEPTAVW
jgi:hypothetical protein